MSHEKDLKQQRVLINDVKKAYQTAHKENIYYMVTLTHKKNNLFTQCIRENTEQAYWSVFKKKIYWISLISNESWRTI